MVKANEKLIEVFEDATTEAKMDRYSDNLTNYVGHITINGRTYEVSLVLEGDVNEMIVDPLDKENIAILEA